MARCSMSKKNVKKYSKKLGLDIIAIQVIGNTNHRKDLFLSDGRLLYLLKDGNIVDSGETHSAK